MKVFLFRMGRVFCILTLLMLLIFNYLIILSLLNDEEWKWYGIFSYITVSFLIFVPILTYHWISFGKFTFWIKDPNKENE